MDTESKNYKGGWDAESLERSVKRLLTEQQAAQYLALSLDTIRRLRYEGTLPAVKIRRVLYDIEDLDQLIERNKFVEPQ